MFSDNSFHPHTDTLYNLVLMFRNREIDNHGINEFYTATVSLRLKVFIEMRVDIERKDKRHANYTLDFTINISTPTIHYLRFSVETNFQSNLPFDIFHFFSQLAFLLLFFLIKASYSIFFYRALFSRS